MDLDRKPCRSAALHTETMEDELLLYDPSGTRIIQLNPTAALIWQLCDGQRRVEEIVALLQAAYPESAGSIAEDVQEILAAWVEAQCIQLA